VAYFYNRYNQMGLNVLSNHKRGYIELHFSSFFNGNHVTHVIGEGIECREINGIKHEKKLFFLVTLEIKIEI
jgi:hypothetical protein